MVKCPLCVQRFLGRECKTFVAQRVISLYLGCECRRNRIPWTVKDLAATFNVGKTTVENILKRYKAHRLRVVVDLRSRNRGRRRKLTPAQEQWLISPA